MCATSTPSSTCTTRPKPCTRRGSWACCGPEPMPGARLSPRFWRHALAWWMALAAATCQAGSQAHDAADEVLSLEEAQVRLEPAGGPPREAWVTLSHRWDHEYGNR